MTQKDRLIVGISGSSGAALGIRLLEILRPTPIETHLIITPAARLTIQQETNWKVEDVAALADVVYKTADVGAAPASGSFSTRGMVILPCSIKTLSAVANSYANDLLTRAADVTLKEGRPLILAVREAPLHTGHIRLIELAAQSGAIIFPPVPAFYTHPLSVDDIVTNIAGRVLSRLGIETPAFTRWSGTAAGPAAAPAEQAAASLLALPAMTLATVGAQGEPHAASLYFAARDLKSLYFFSYDHSQHGSDLSQQPEAAATLTPTVFGWRDIQGLQLRGRVEPLSPGTEWDQAWELYRAKFPFVAAMQDVVQKNGLFVFRTRWARLIDNAKGFGYKEEWPVE
jgi:flavin prenyltransferase